MSDKTNDAQRVIDAVVVGDLTRLAPALLALAKAQPVAFLNATRQLLDTEQRKHVALLIGVLDCGKSDFYHADGKVFGAVYTHAQFPRIQAGPVGVGLDYEEVKKIVLDVRAKYDEEVLLKAIELKDVLGDLNGLLRGHSFVDLKLSALADVDLRKGQALLVAALNPPAQ